MNICEIGALQWSAGDLLDAGAWLERQSKNTNKEKSEPLHDRNQYIVTGAGTGAKTPPGHSVLVPVLPHPASCPRLMRR